MGAESLLFSVGSLQWFLYLDREVKIMMSEGFLYASGNINGLCLERTTYHMDCKTCHIVKCILHIVL